jgi:serine-type D-Ala-D-Ala carboxypeptidase/endopeptidase (penicillin-binding protein 4)
VLRPGRALALLCVLAPAFAWSESRTGKDPADAHAERVARLRERITEVLRDRPLSKTRVGVVVTQGSSGDVLFAHNPQVAFNPASNTKMLTTAAAMSALGPGFRYRTSIYGAAPDEEGVVHGDVVLRGSGDPSLMPADLAQLAHGLASRGITRIEGDLYADPRFHDASRTGDARAAAGEGALILSRNTYQVHVSPGDLGHHAIVRVEPRSDYFGVENQATTVKGKRSRLRIDAYRKDDRLIVTVRGRITENRGTYVDVRRLADGAFYSGHILAAALGDFGITLTGKVKTGGVAAASELLAEHASAPLADISRVSNKPSNNFVADQIYKTLGGELYGMPPSLDKGTRAVTEYLSSAGIKPGAYKIVNGSGLTHENRITAQDLNALLRHIYRDVSLAPEFLSSLAIAGIDGTIRNRFLGTEAVGLVRAKTGTLSGVSALSGYVGDKDDVIVFSIFVEGFRNRRTTEVRHAQVRMVEAMLRYLRSDAPSTTGEKGEAGVDYESDGDPEQ